MLNFKMIRISPVFLFSNKDKLACMQMTKKRNARFVTRSKDIRAKYSCVTRDNKRYISEQGKQEKSRKENLYQHDMMV